MFSSTVFSNINKKPDMYPLATVCVCSCRFSPLSSGSLSIIPGVKLSKRGWETNISPLQWTAMCNIQQFMEDVFLDKLLPTDFNWKVFGTVKPRSCWNDRFCPGAANLKEKVHSYLQGICWPARRWHSPSNKSTPYLNIYWQSWKGVWGSWKLEWLFHARIDLRRQQLNWCIRKRLIKTVTGLSQHTTYRPLHIREGGTGGQILDNSHFYQTPGNLDQTGQFYSTCYKKGFMDKHCVWWKRWFWPS